MRRAIVGKPVASDREHGRLDGRRLAFDDGEAVLDAPSVFADSGNRYLGATGFCVVRICDLIVGPLDQVGCYGLRYWVASVVLIGGVDAEHAVFDGQLCVKDACRILRHRVGFIGGASCGIDPKSGGSLEVWCGHIAGELIADGDVAQVGIA